jgi:hypothetical protein
MKHIIKLFCLIYLLFATNLLAQGQWKEGKNSIDDAQMSIEKETQLSVPKAARNFNKMDKLPQATSTGTSQDQQYKFVLANYPLPILDPAVNIVERVPSKPQPQTGNYIKAGFGNYTTPYLEAFINSKNNTTYQAGIHFKHLSSQSGAVNSKNSASSFNNIDVFGKYFLPKATLYAALGYDRQMVKFYGYGKDAPEAIIDTFHVAKQIYQTVYGNVGLKSTERSDALFYQAEIQFHRLTDNFKTNENNVNIGGKVGYNVGKDTKIGIGVNIIAQSRTDSINQNRNMLLLSPTYQIKKEALELLLGLNIAYEAKAYEPNKKYDSLGGGFYVYPNISAKYHVIPQELSIVGSLIGNLQQNTLRGFAQENPFVSPYSIMAHTNNIATAKIGIEGSLSSKFGAKAGMSYGAVRNLNFYINNPNDTTNFLITYDHKMTSVFAINGEMSLTLDAVSSTFRAEYFNYGMSGEGIFTSAWHRPTFIGSWNTIVKATEQVRIVTDFYALGGITTPIFTADKPIVRNLPAIIDLNLKGEYIFNRRLTAFLAFNNVLGQNYQRWQNYYVRGFQVMGGFTYSF